MTELENLLEQVDVIEVGADLARTAGDLAQHHGLCGYDAVAAALAAADDDVALVTGDADLATAAADAGLAVARPTG